MRLPLGLALGLFGLLAAGAAPVASQTRPAAPPRDPIDHSMGISRQTFPRAPAPQPTERWVPERRIRLPGADREVVVPGHWERRLSDQQSEAPPLPAYGPRGEVIVHVPGGARPPAEIRQGP